MPRPPLSRRTQLTLVICALALAGLSIHRLRQKPGDSGPLRLSGATMGTTYSVLIARGGEPSRAQAQAVVETALQRVNGLMSTYDKSSELSRFNRHDTTPFSVSPETAQVFRVAEQVSELSGGAFDVTVGPLVALWGFGADAQDESTAPTPEAVDAARRKVGFRKLRLDLQARTLTKSEPSVVCDLSAVAKGYAVDEVARALDRFAVRGYLVEVGGELKAKGNKADGSPWRVGIERPDAALREVQGTVVLQDAALATSGDYRNYYERDGQRLSHTIDPRTAAPVRHRLASVSVRHESAAWADAWATALNVLGPEEGRRTAEEQGLAAYFIVRSAESGFETFTTGDFAVVSSGH